MVAFEASPKAAAALRASIAANGLPVTFHELALGEKKELVCADSGPPPAKQEAAGEASEAAEEARLAQEEAARRGYGPAAAEGPAEGCERRMQREPAVQAVLAALPQGRRVRRLSTAIHTSW